MINIPNGAPTWVYTIYWMVFAIGMALALLVPVVVKAFIDVNRALNTVKKSNHHIQSSADAAAINSAIATHKIDSLVPGPDGADPQIKPILPMDTTDAEMIDTARRVKGEH